MEDDKLISLKEASKLTGYSADYIGQLIRCGKLRGEKVYSQISWMTTKQDIENYKKGVIDQSGNQDTGDFKAFAFKNYLNRLRGEINFIKLFFSHIKSLVPYLILFSASIVFLSFFLLDAIFNDLAHPSVNKGLSVEDLSGY